MASLTMEPGDWDELREVLRRIPEKKRDESWFRAFESVEMVTKKVRMEADSWAHLRSMLERIPGKERDRKWETAWDRMNFVCNMVLDARDILKDPRKLKDKGEHDAEGAL